MKKTIRTARNIKSSSLNAGLIFRRYSMMIDIMLVRSVKNIENKNTVGTAAEIDPILGGKSTRNTDIKETISNTSHRSLLRLRVL
jgi:hypothetical protein